MNSRNPEKFTVTGLTQFELKKSATQLKNIGFVPITFSLNEYVKNDKGKFKKSKLTPIKNYNSITLDNCLDDNLFYNKNGLALRTGEEGAVFLLDIDTLSDLDIIFNETNHSEQDLENYPNQITGSGGRHYFFAWERKLNDIGTTTKQFFSSSADKFLDIDTKNNNQFAIIAPSEFVAVEGDLRFEYSWKKSILEFDSKTLPKMPDWLYDWCKKALSKQTKRKNDHDICQVITTNNKKKHNRDEKNFYENVSIDEKVLHSLMNYASKIFSPWIKSNVDTFPPRFNKGNTSLIIPIDSTLCPVISGHHHSNHINLNLNLKERTIWIACHSCTGQTFKKQAFDEHQLMNQLLKSLEKKDINFEKNFKFLDDLDSDNHEIDVDLRKYIIQKHHRHLSEPVYQKNTFIAYFNRNPLNVEDNKVYEENSDGLFELKIGINGYTFHNQKSDTPIVFYKDHSYFYQRYFTEFPVTIYENFEVNVFTNRRDLNLKMAKFLTNPTSYNLAGLYRGIQNLHLGERYTPETCDLFENFSVVFNSIDNNVYYFKKHYHIWEKSEYSKKEDTGRYIITDEVLETFNEIFQKLLDFQLNISIVPNEHIITILKKIIITMEQISFQDQFLRVCASSINSSLHDFNYTFNKDPLKLGYKDFVFDMESNQKIKGKKDHFISQSLFKKNFEYVEPTQEAFDFVNNFLEEILPDPDIRKYLLQCLAYGLSGLTDNAMFHIFLGEGSNGKSLLTDMYSKLAGDYHIPCDPSLLTSTMTPSPQNASPEIAKLKNIRVAMMTETGQNSPINEEILKRLLSNEEISAREIYGKPFSFSPIMKIFLSTNFAPTINSTEYGTWRRIVILKFPNKFVPDPSPDRPYEKLVKNGLKEELEKDIHLSAFFHIIMDHFVKDLAARIPKKLLLERKKYMESESTALEFLNYYEMNNEKLIEKDFNFEDDETVRLKILPLFQQYIFFCKANNYKIPTRKHLHSFRSELMGFFKRKKTLKS